jgi:hypothetical protein
VNNFRLLATDWTRSYLSMRPEATEASTREWRPVTPGLGVKWTVIPAGARADLAGMAGSHPRIEQGGYQLKLLPFHGPAPAA